MSEENTRLAAAVAEEVGLVGNREIGIGEKNSQ